MLSTSAAAVLKTLTRGLSANMRPSEPIRVHILLVCVYRPILLFTLQKSARSDTKVIVRSKLYATDKRTAAAVITFVISLCYSVHLQNDKQRDIM